MNYPQVNGIAYPLGTLASRGSQSAGFYRRTNCVPAFDKRHLRIWYRMHKEGTGE